MQEIVKILIDPILFFWITLICFLFVKGPRRKHILYLNIIFYFISIEFNSVGIREIWKVNDTFDKRITYDAVVVLTGIVNYSHYLQKQEGNKLNYDFRFSNNVDRFIKGIYFVKEGNAKILLIGDMILKTFSEGSILKKFGDLQGLSNDQIKLYGEVRRTIDEAKGVNEFVKNNSINKLLLVTSESHMRRALAIFAKQGLFPDIYSVNKSNNNFSLQLFIPSSRGIRKLNGCLYELVGYVGYYLRGDI